MEDAPEAACESLGAAVQLGDPQIASAAADAFVSGMHTASIVAAAARAGRRRSRSRRRVSATARPPGRPRSTEADAAITRATLEVLREEGFRGLSVEAVRQRAGVGKATIYRRFPDSARDAAAAGRGG